MDSTIFHGNENDQLQEAEFKDIPKIKVKEGGSKLVHFDEISFQTQNRTQ